VRSAAIGAARRNLARDGETSWAEAYEANAEIQSGGNFIRIDRETLLGASKDMDYEQFQGWQRLGPETLLDATHMLSII
jgi:hypothetical protein